MLSKELLILKYQKNTNWNEINKLNRTFDSWILPSRNFRQVKNVGKRNERVK